MLRNTIKMNLITVFSAIILIPFLALSIYLITQESRKINSRTFAALNQNCVSVADAAQREIDQMNMVSTDIAYSYLIKDSYSQYLANQNDSAQTKSLYDLISTTIGPNRPVDQVNIFTTVDTLIAAGVYSNIYNHPVQIKPWYEKARERNGRSVVSYGGYDALLARYTTDPYGKRFFSLAREYYDRYNNVQGFIEVKDSVRRVLSQAIDYHSVYGEQILVLADDGEVILPLESDAISGVAERIRALRSPSVFSEVSGGDLRGFATYTELASGIRVAIFIDQDSLFLPVNSYIRGVTLLTLVSLALAILLAYLAANRITVPIEQIYGQIRLTNLSGYMPRIPLKTKNIELNVLYDSFLELQHELVDSLNKQLLLKNQEMQSKMLALQSQMNPHFLFNSLQTIQSMADGNMNDEIVVMCQSMSSILRYISSDTETTVPLADEIRNTADFLCCMAIRYRNDLHYTFDFPEDMCSLHVPKLCIQPLVENSIRYCTTMLPPYHIHVSGAMAHGRYTITATDNGPGFTEEAIALIQEKILEIDETGLLPSLEIKGMGLLNIYLRFKILYDSDVIFRIINKENGGASITIGGRYE
ncbi:MAG: histidine kinase [Eubacteriales bacterium]|nr:histidine kinase [Eubacteriales bacterium]